MPYIQILDDDRELRYAKVIEEDTDPLSAKVSFPDGSIEVVYAEEGSGHNGMFEAAMKKFPNSRTVWRNMTERPVTKEDRGAAWVSNEVLRFMDTARDNAIMAQTHLHHLAKEAFAKENNETTT